MEQIRIDALEKIVRTAGNEMLSAPRTILQEKGSPANYVTACDLKIEKILEERLPTQFPGIPIFSEENRSTWAPEGMQWIVDPLDGTANFRHGFGASVLSLALMVQGSIRIGMVYDAENGRLFSAVRGKGAFLNGRALHVSAEPFSHALAFVQFGVYDKAHAHPHAASVFRIFQECEDLRSLGSSALELAMIGAGKAELFYAPRLYPWDFAAASLIIEEAGGVIGTPDAGGLFSGKPRSIWAANSAASGERLRKLLQEAGEA